MNSDADPPKGERNIVIALLFACLLLALLIVWLIGSALMGD